MPQYEDRIPYEGDNAQTLHRKSDLEVAWAMKKKAGKSQLPEDWIMAAELFEKCNYWDQARRCREAAEGL